MNNTSDTTKSQPINKIRRKLPVWLTAAEIIQLLSVVDSPRDRLLVQCLYYLGLRNSEAGQLQADHIDVKNRIVRIPPEIAKRGMERRIPIPDNFLPTLKQYLALIGEKSKLFGLSRARVWSLIKNYGVKAQLAKPIKPHVLRHSYASHVYQVTGDIKLVQELLGHASIDSAVIYTHCDDASKRRGIEGVF